MSLKFEGLEKGTAIRAFDFEPLEGRPDQYIEGKIININPKWIDYDCYAILIDHDTTPKMPRKGRVAYVPMETTFDFDNRIEEI